MQKFNKTISIEVDVDSIYEKLLGTFPEDYKHREMLSHAIIGSTLSNNNIGYIYNALNGYTNEVDFEVGEEVVCTTKLRTVRYNTGSKEAPTGGYKEEEIGRCTIKEINLYSRDKLYVSFTTFPRHFEKEEVVKAWVNHKDCTKIPKDVLAERNE